MSSFGEPFFFLFMSELRCYCNESERACGLRRGSSNPSCIGCPSTARTCGCEGPRDSRRPSRRCSLGLSRCRNANAPVHHRQLDARSVVNGGAINSRTAEETCSPLSERVIVSFTHESLTRSPSNGTAGNGALKIWPKCSKTTLTSRVWSDFFSTTTCKYFSCPKGPNLYWDWFVGQSLSGCVHRIWTAPRL
jgi:hypothetical protein